MCEHVRVRFEGGVVMADKEKPLIIREFGVTISAKSHNPTILSPAFLEMHEIVDKTWPLSETEKPICLDPYARVVYQNGVQITSEPQRISFFDPLLGKSVQETPVIDMAKKYLKAVPLVSYEAVGINPSGDISVGDDKDSARVYVIEHILTKKNWASDAEGPVRAIVNLKIPLQNMTWNLSIEDGVLTQSGEPERPVVIFRSNFHHAIQKLEGKQSWQTASEIIDAWHDDLKMFSDLLSRYFVE